MDNTEIPWNLWFIACVNKFRLLYSQLNFLWFQKIFVLCYFFNELNDAA